VVAELLAHQGWCLSRTSDAAQGEGTKAESNGGLPKFGETFTKQQGRARKKMWVGLWIQNSETSPSFLRKKDPQLADIDPSMSPFIRARSTSNSRPTGG